MADESVAIGGQPVTADGIYRITVNSFPAGGGEGFTVLEEGTDPVTGPIDLDAFTAYPGETSPVAAPTTDRITAAG